MKVQTRNYVEGERKLWRSCGRTFHFGKTNTGEKGYLSEKVSAQPLKYLPLVKRIIGTWWHCFMRTAKRKLLIASTLFVATWDFKLVMTSKWRKRRKCKSMKTKILFNAAGFQGLQKIEEALVCVNKITQIWRHSMIAPFLIPLQFEFSALNAAFIVCWLLKHVTELKYLREFAVPEAI